MPKQPFSNNSLICLFCLVNELPLLSDDCRYLVLLAKIQNKVEKNEESLFSLKKVSDSFFSISFCVINYKNVIYFLCD